MGRGKKRKRGAKKGKSFPVHPKFQDMNLTSLESMKRTGKSLKAPFSDVLGGITFTSWVDDCIPNSLWSCILTSFLDQGEYLSLFRRVVVNARENIEDRKNLFITHNYFGAMSDEVFDALMKPVIEHPEAISLLRALRLVSSLPDHRHWDRHAPSPDAEKDWSILIHAVADNFDHQSQRATDIRWLKLAFGTICREQIVLPPEFAEELRLYPDYGDMRKVRPTIRAAEIAFRSIEIPSHDLEKHAEDSEWTEPPELESITFWKEMLETVDCIFPEYPSHPISGPKELVLEAFDMLEKLNQHFFETLQSSSPDPRHDGAFGLALYATTLLFNSASGYVHGRPEGRILVRTIAEAMVTLHYLTVKDDPTLWLKYRRYGAGQAKLAFLKYLRDAETPDFIDVEMMERIANEDMWLEFEDIELGNWAGTDLRKMSIEAGCKDVYDNFYDWMSGFSHGHWAAIRDSVFVNCLNPLHRFHRIPALPKGTMPSTLIDSCKLCNRVLDDLNHLYPSFKSRIKWHKHPRDADAAGVAEAIAEEGQPE